MRKTPKNSNKDWTNSDINKLKELARGNTPTPLIAYKLDRSVDAVRSKANDINVSLKPTNKSPYNRQEK